VREVVVRTVAERAALSAEDGDETHSSSEDTLRRALGPDDPLPYFGPYFGMSGKQLAAELKARSLKVSGKKMELVARLEMDDAERRRGRIAREQTHKTVGADMRGRKRERASSITTRLTFARRDDDVHISQPFWHSRQRARRFRRVTSRVAWRRSPR
jgi:hypothetical protein